MINRRGCRGFRRGTLSGMPLWPLRNPLTPPRFVFVLTAFTLALTTQVVSQNSHLLELGGASKSGAVAKAPSQFTVVTYNIRWRAGDELQKIADWLKAKQPAIIALQEVDRVRQRTGKTNTARVIAEKLGMYYAWAAPPSVKDATEEETGVELLSPYPLSDVTRIVLPHPGPGRRRRIALGASLQVGGTSIRVYSVHSENRLAESLKAEQLNAVLADLERHSKTMPAIVMGDFNTWERPMIDCTRELFTTAGFNTPFPDGRATFQRTVVLFDLELKLDWIWLRGFESKDFGIDRNFTVSDHFPLWMVVTLKENGEPLKDGSPR